MKRNEKKMTYSSITYAYSGTIDATYFDTRYKIFFEKIIQDIFFFNFVFQGKKNKNICIHGL